MVIKRKNKITLCVLKYFLFIKSTEMNFKKRVFNIYIKTKPVPNRLSEYRSI